MLKVPHSLHRGEEMAGHSVFPCFIFLIISHFFIESLPLISAQKPVFACDVGTTPTLSTFPFCDPSLDIKTRVNDLVNRMTLPEKIGNLGNAAAAVPRLGIPKYEWWSEALHGVSYTGPGVHFSSLVPGATSFPQVILTAASFNESLFETIGKVVSTEARAMYNVGLAGLTYWSPNVNILRDPRWGRAQEVPGEDPTLTSKYGAAYVRGLQQRDDGDEDRLKVASCCKHYTAYDVDNWHGIQRYTFNAVVTKQDMDDTFQPPFEKCISEGNVASVMCSYNQLNGIPTCGDPDLLAGIIRGQWNLNGYIVTDCDSLQVMFENQHYTKTPEETIALSLNSGLDLNCGGYLQKFAQSAIQKGLVNVSVIDRALTNNFATLMRLGFFDGDPTKQMYGNLGPEDVCTPGNQELAREAARQGIVLLKNTEGSLPLSPDSIKSLAVIGPNANASHTMLGNYEGTPCKYVTPLQGLTATVPTVFQAGCANVACGAAQMDAAVKVAAVADAVVLVMGSDQSIEKESLDRTDVTLPGQQQLLISGVANASRGAVILVIMSGGGWDIQFAKDNPKITSILWVGLPGEAGGAAISDIIFGLHNPSGRLPMTWYPQSYVVNVPMTNMNMRPDPATGYPGRTYRFYKGKTVYSFGDGLSYTPFEHTLVTAPPDAVSLFLEEGHFCHKSKCKSIDRTEKTCKNSGFSLKLKVKNKGKMSGSHTVLLFSTPPSVHNAAQKHLVGFKKVHLEAQGEGLVQFKVDVCEHLGLVDEAGNKRVAIGEHVLHIGDLKHSLTVRI